MLDNVDWNRIIPPIVAISLMVFVIVRVIMEALEE